MELENQKAKKRISVPDVLLCSFTPDELQLIYESRLLQEEIERKIGKNDSSDNEINADETSDTESATHYNQDDLKERFFNYGFCENTMSSDFTTRSSQSYLVAMEGDISGITTGSDDSDSDHKSAISSPMWGQETNTPSQKKKIIPEPELYDLTHFEDSSFDERDLSLALEQCVIPQIRSSTPLAKRISEFSSSIRKSYRGLGYLGSYVVRHKIPDYLIHTVLHDGYRRIWTKLKRFHLFR